MSQDVVQEISSGLLEIWLIPIAILLLLVIVRRLLQ